MTAARPSGAWLNAPEGVALDPGGNVVIADTGNSRIRVVAAKTGVFYGKAMTAGDIYTVAGNGTAGFSGDGGPAASASLDTVYGVAAPGAGNLVIADSGNQRVRVVATSSGTFYGQAMTAGDIYTVAGNGTTGFSGDGVPATAAQFYIPEGVATDSVGDMAIADSGNERVRVVAASAGTLFGRAMTSGDIYTVAGDGSGGFSWDGGPGTSAEIAGPEGVATDRAGNVVIADTSNHRIRVVAASTGTFYGQAMTAGDIYTVAGNGTRGYNGDGGPATSAWLSYPSGVAVDAAGNLLIADTSNYRIRVVAETTGTFYGQQMTAGHIYTVAGNGTSGYSGDSGPATSAEIDFPYTVAVDGAGNLLIADTLNDRVRAVAASTGTFYGQAMTAGDIYTVAGNGTVGYSGDGGPATSAGLLEPEGIAVDGAGNLIIADDSGRARIVASTTGTLYGVTMATGDIYTVAGNGNSGFSGDGGPATSAELGARSVAIDPSGNLMILDAGSNRVRMVAR